MNDEKSLLAMARTVDPSLFNEFIDAQLAKPSPKSQADDATVQDLAELAAPPWAAKP